MNRQFAIQLAEKVSSMFVFTFIATYLAGVGSNPTLDHIFNLSLGQKASVAGITAAVQLLLSTTVAPFVGDPNSPSLIPKGLLPRDPAPAPTLIVSLEDIVGATLKKLAGQAPGAEVKVAEVVDQLIADSASKPAEKPVTE